MLKNMPLQDIMIMLAPLVILELGFIIYCITAILRNGVRSLNKGVWILIVVLFSNMLIGPICFLMFGKKRWEDDQN